MKIDDFDIGDAIFIGGAVGMAHDLMNEEDRPPEETEEVEDDFEEIEPKGKNIKLVQQLDPELYGIVVDVIKEQEEKRKANIEKDKLIREKHAVLYEAAELEQWFKEEEV